MRQKAALGMTVPTASVTVVPHTALNNKVPSRVELWSHTSGPIIWYSVGVSKITARTAPEDPQDHAKCEASREFAHLPKRFSKPVLGVHQCSSLRQIVCFLVAEPHRQRNAVSYPLTVATMTWNPEHIHGVSPNILGEPPKFTPELAKLIVDGGSSVSSFVPSLFEFQVVRDNGDVTRAFVPQRDDGSPKLACARTCPRKSYWPIC